jgi:hypothetical protein
MTVLSTSTCPALASRGSVDPKSIACPEGHEVVFKVLTVILEDR